MSTFLSHERHFFDPVLAERFGVVEAIVIQHFIHWITINKRAKRNFYEGRYWSYQTIEEIALHFIYLSEKQIERILNRLCEENILIKGNYNKNKFDRTCWYAFQDEERFILLGETHFPNSGNGNPQIGKSIKDTDRETQIYKQKSISKDIPKKVGVSSPKPPVPNTSASPFGSEQHIFFSFEDNKFKNITDKNRAAWKEAYPNVELNAELPKIEIWCQGNVKKSKLKKNWFRFISNWLSKTHERAENRTIYKNISQNTSLPPIGPNHPLSDANMKNKQIFVKLMEIYTSWLHQKRNDLYWMNRPTLSFNGTSVEIFGQNRIVANKLPTLWKLLTSGAYIEGFRNAVDKEICEYCEGLLNYEN